MEKNAILVENLTFLAKICHFSRKCLGTLEIFTKSEEKFKKKLRLSHPSPAIPKPLKILFNPLTF
jgi:hypothetical protein